MTQTTNLIFAGVGGQGVLLIAEVTALTAVRAGLDVKQTEVHGVSQRGGSVESHVRFGPVVHSPLVRLGEADCVVGLEMLEALRYASFVRPGAPANGHSNALAAGLLLVNDHRIIPGSVAGAADKYPDNGPERLRQHGLRVLALPASRIARDLGDARAANVVMLGYLSTLLPQLEMDDWRAVLTEKLPGKIRALNEKAFEKGREQAYQLLSE